MSAYIAVPADHCVSPDADIAPERLLRSGQARLAAGDAGGVLPVLQAAARDPSLLRVAAETVGGWLNGDGAAHDTPALRQELARMLALHHAAWLERNEIDGSEDYRMPPPQLAAAVAQALQPWLDDIRAAWLGERICRRAPRWRHHELLLELKPRTWHFQADARARLRQLAQEIGKVMPRGEGSVQVRLHPLLAPPAHVRNMRRKALPLALADAARQQGGTGTVAGTSPARQQPAENGDNGGKKGDAGRRTALRRATTTVKSGMLATLLVLPLWAGWQLWRNDDTQRRLQALEQAHAARLARHFWRREEAAGRFSPVKTVQAFLAGMRSGRMPIRPPLLDAESRASFARLHHDRRRLRAIGLQWAGCGEPFAVVEMDRAVVRWPADKPQCTPLLLRREAGRWRIAWNATRATFASDAHGHWRFMAVGTALPRAWLFAFRDMLVDASGYARPLRGAPGKGGLILSPAPAPRYENAPALRGALLERHRPGGHMRHAE